MATRLYETLELHHDASPDEIRRAYKKRALKTHPDRAPPERKQIADDEFRKVNAAYEVLIDEEKRALYDRHGVYPPPEPIEEMYSNPYTHEYAHGMHFSPPPPPQSRPSFERQSRRNAPQPADPFVQMFNEEPFPSTAPHGSGPFGMYHPTFAFTDPYKIFDHVFTPGTIPFPPQHFLPIPMSIQPSPMMPFAGGPGFIVFPEQPHVFPGSGSVWTEETHITKIVEGREQRISTRVDREGNVRCTYDVDGRHWETFNNQMVQPYEEIYDAPKHPLEYPHAPPPTHVPSSRARSSKSSSGKKSRYTSPSRGYAYASAPQPPLPPSHHTRTTSHHIPSSRRRRMHSYSQEDLGSPMSEAETIRPYSYEFAPRDPPRYEYYQPASSREQHTKKRYEDARLPTPPRDPDVTRRRTMRPDGSHTMVFGDREREPAFTPPNPEHEAKEKRWWQKFKN